jgi:hypothetical protein
VGAFEQRYDDLARAHPALIHELRAELAARPASEAHACPSWSSYAAWLSARGHAELGEWLRLAVERHGCSGGGEARRRVRLAAMRALGAEGGGGVEARLSGGVGLWLAEAESSWSLWVGPFMIAYLGPGPSREQLQARLGVHATFLARERVFVGGEAFDSWLEDLSPGVPLLVAHSLPGATSQVHELLSRALSARARGRGSGGGGEARCELAVCETRSQLEAQIAAWPRLRTLDAVIFVGPPELLEDWPHAGRLRTLLDPQPSFEARYHELAREHPELITCLRAELDARPLSEARSCPSWPVFMDWLLERGEELLVRWLKAELACPPTAGERDKDQLRLRITAKSTLEELAAERPAERGRLLELWSPRQEPSLWFGPFVLAHLDPELEYGLGALELQATLGRLAMFLPRERVCTTLAQLERARELRAARGHD